MTNILLYSGYRYYGTSLSGDGVYMIILLALLAVMVIGIIVQARLNSYFKKYSEIPSEGGRRAADIANEVLYENGCETAVTSVSGSLTDHYNPKTNTVGLSNQVYDSTSVAALAIAMHEVGHVLQHKEGYTPIKIRNSILPVANIGSTIAPFIVIIGFFLGFGILAMVGVCLYAAVLGFQLVTLPVEFNASNRAIHILESKGYLTRDEIPGAKKVLRMAAMTYVVGTLATLISLLRLMLIARGAGRRR